MVFVTVWSLWFMFASAQKHCEWLLAQCHPDVGDEPGKRAGEGIKPGIFQMHRDYQSQKPHVRHPSQISIKPTHCTKPLQPFQGHVPTGTGMRSALHQAIQNVYNKLLSFWRNISLPKSIVTLSTQTFKMSFEKACLSAVISSILMVLYGVLSSGTFPNAAEPLSPAPLLAYECVVTCGSGLVRSSLSQMSFGNHKFTTKYNQWLAGIKMHQKI